jgi:hypothetical protein
MSEIVQWHGSAITVQARLIPRYLWTTASIDVFLDGQCILRTGGQMKFIGSQSATFTHAAASHTATLSWDTGILRYFPYKLRIDEVAISEANVPIENWPAALIVSISIGMALVFGIFYFIR